MKYAQYRPAESLRPYIRSIAIAENDRETSYKVFPSAGLVMGFQYAGRLSCASQLQEKPLTSAGITGIANQYRVFKSHEQTGSVLVYFSPVGYARFSTLPAHELSNLSLSLDHLFNSEQVARFREELINSTDDYTRVTAVENFLRQQFIAREDDRLVGETVRLICASAGQERIGKLTMQLGASQSVIEKRFRAVVGTSPKAFASIIRFQHVLNLLGQQEAPLDLSFDSGFYDQAHFIKSIKQFTGETPAELRQRLQKNDFLQS